MADITYGVNVEYLSSGNLNLPTGSSGGIDKATSGMKALHSAASSVNGALDSIIGGLVNMGTAAATGIGAAVSAGLVLAAHQAVKFNAEMENSQTGIATMANAAEGLNGFLDPKEAFGNQYRLAGDTLKQMRKDAQELPGSFSDLQRIMTDLAGPAENIGLGQAGVEKMSANAMSAAAAMNLPFKQVGMQIGEMLSGSARVTNRTFKGLNTGYSSKDFNKLSGIDRLHVTQAALEKMQAGRASAQQNWSTVSSNFVDNLKIGVGVVGGPLLNRVKEVMTEFNGSDKSGFAKIGDKIGRGLVNAFDAGLAAFKKWFPIVETFVETMHRGLTRVFDGLGNLFAIILPRIESFLNDPQAFHKIESLIATLAGLKMGASVAEGSAELGGGALKMLSGMGVGAAELGPAALGLAGAVALAAFAVGGFTNALTDSSSKMHESVTVSAKTTAAAAERLGRNLGKGTIFTDAYDLAGAALGRITENVVGYLANCAQGFQEMADIMVALNVQLGLIKPNAKLHGIEEDEKDFASRENDRRNAEFLENYMPLKTFGARATPEHDPPTVPNHTTHIHHVEIKVMGEADPSRVARKTVGILQDLARNPTSARLNPAARFSTQQ